MPAPLVKLTLIDDATDTVIGESDLEAEALPDSFRSDTILHLREQDWSVVQADPTSRAEYEAARRLVLRLRRIEHADASRILFSLPTICHAVPPTEGPLLEGHELLLHEDQWRQVEWVSVSQAGVVDEELAEVRRVLTQSRVDGGFRDIHVRRRLEEPLKGAELAVEHLRQAFAPAAASRVVLHDSSHCVSDSFSFFLDRHFALYGLGRGARIEVLGAAALDETSEGVPLLEQVRQLAADHDLLAVDWSGGRKARAGDTALESVLRGPAAG